MLFFCCVGIDNIISIIYVSRIFFSIHIYLCIKISYEQFYLLFFSFSGDVALFDLPLAEEVPQVAEDGEDAVAHVREHGHEHRGLFKQLDERPAV